MRSTRKTEIDLYCKVCDAYRTVNATEYCGMIDVVEGEECCYECDTPFE